MKRFLLRQTIGWLFLAGQLTGLSGCSTGRHLSQLYRSSSELYHPDTTLLVKRITVKRETVKIVKKNGSQQTLPIREVWGYQSLKGELYRFYKDVFYEIVQIGPMLVYVTEEGIGQSSVESYYFSLTPNSDLYSVNRKNINWVFRHNPCMIQLLKDTGINRLLTTDAHGSYQLVNAYCYCQGDRYGKQ